MVCSKGTEEPSCNGVDGARSGETLSALQAFRDGASQKWDNFNAYYQQGERLYYARLSSALIDLKKHEETAFLTEVSSVPLQQTLRHLDRAFLNFFEGRAEYPTFKKKHGPQSATYVGTAFKWDGTHLTLAKMDAPLDIRWSRPLPDGCTPMTATLTKDCAGRYFVSFLVEEEIKPLPVAPKMVGLDLGLKSMVRPMATRVSLPKMKRSWHERNANMPGSVKAPRTVTRTCGPCLWRGGQTWAGENPSRRVSTKQESQLARVWNPPVIHPGE